MTPYSYGGVTAINGVPPVTRWLFARLGRDLRARPLNHGVMEISLRRGAPMHTYKSRRCLISHLDRVIAELLREVLDEG